MQLIRRYRYEILVTALWAVTVAAKIKFDGLVFGLAGVRV